MALLSVQFYLVIFFRDSQTTSVASSQTETKLLGEISLFQKNRETVLVFGGRDPHKTYGVGRNTAKDIFRYLPDNNAWEFVGELPEPRQHHCTEFFKGRIWLVGKKTNNYLIFIIFMAQLGLFMACSFHLWILRKMTKLKYVSHN